MAFTVQTIAEHPLLYPTLFLLSVCYVAATLRYLITNFMYQSYSRDLALEFIATLECFCCCFECSVIGANYGLCVYLVYAFFLILWRSCSWNAETGCPYRPLEDVLECKTYLSDAIGLIIFQLAAGILANRLMLKYWKLGISSIHRGLQKGDCPTEINAPVALAFIAEGVGTFLGRLVSRKLGDLEWRVVAHIVDAVFTLVLVVAAFHLSGAFFNPAYASVRRIGCKRKRFGKHLLVYWVAPIWGALVSSVVYNKIKYIKLLPDFPQTRTNRDEPRPKKVKPPPPPPKATPTTSKDMEEEGKGKKGKKEKKVKPLAPPPNATPTTSKDTEEEGKGKKGKKEKKGKKGKQDEPNEQTKEQVKGQSKEQVKGQSKEQVKGQSKEQQQAQVPTEKPMKGKKGKKLQEPPLAATATVAGTPTAASTPITAGTPTAAAKAASPSSAGSTIGVPATPGAQAAAGTPSALGTPGDPMQEDTFTVVKGKKGKKKK